MNWNKYHAKKQVIDGITFDSQAEATRYCELVLMEKAHEIKDLEVHPKYELVPKFTKAGKKHRGITYEADFRYVRCKDNVEIIEDVKGVRTAVYKLKKELFEWLFPTKELTEVRIR